MRLHLLRPLVLVAALAACDGGAGTCENPTCYDECLASGYVGGACSPGSCVCVPFPEGGPPRPDGGTDADAEGPADGDGDADMDGDGDADVEADAEPDIDAEADVDVGVCDDGTCDPGETAASCPEDCPEVCGDGECTHEEDATSCEDDCPAVCGDGECTHDENAATCLDDCEPFCGDGACTPGESPCSCADCQVCGDGICTFTEAYPPGTCADCDTSPIWVALCPGTYMAGSPAGERGRDADESQHEVTLTRAFLIQATEVTQDQYVALMGYSISDFPGCGGSCPMDQVSWNEAAAYCNALSDAEGFARCYDCSGSGWEIRCSLSPTHASPYACPGYRLPTEAEWEYAARAGDTRATYNGDIDSDLCTSAVLAPIACYCGTAGWDGTRSPPCAVASYVPNSWGLFDMLGNVWEWCHDIYLTAYGSAPAVDPFVPGSTRSDGTWPDSRATRGAYANAWGSNVRAAQRHAGHPDWGTHHDWWSYTYYGFRPVRTLDP